MRHREEAKDLAEADGQIAINMVLDLKREVSETQERNRKAMYWRLFAGLVLIVVVILSVMNYTSRKEQVEVFSSFIEASPLALNDNLVVENNDLNKLRLADLKATLFFYHQLKEDYERRIRAEINEGKIVVPFVLQNIKEFNQMAEARGMDPVILPHLTNSKGGRKERLGVASQGEFISTP